MENIFIDSDDDFSDDTSVTNRRLSRTIVPNFEENDDKTEKSAKRKSMLFENGQINKMITNPVQSSQKYELPSGYTEEQIGAHYGNCIKLASENKINSKNAFDLHLIDILINKMKEFAHFQTISSTLDAGSKIYAGRVDSIHQNTYQVLTGLGNPTDEKTDTPGPEVTNEDSVSDEELELKTNKKTKRKLLVKNTICQNLRKIRIDPLSIKSEVDPLFQSQAENFDEGGNCELRCNNLRLLDKTYELLLDSEKIIYTNYREDEPLNNSEDLKNFDLTQFYSTFQKMKNGQVKLIDQFEDFIFTGWNKGSETMNSTTAESFRNMMNEISKLDQQMEAASHVDVEPMNDFDNGDDYEANNYGMDDDGDYYEIMKEDKLDDDDNSVQIGSSKANNIDGNMFISSVKGLVNSVVEHYGEMNHTLLGLWAGPMYFRKKAKPLKTHKTNTEKKTQPVIKPSNQSLPIFPEKIQTKLNEEGIGRVVLPDNWKFTKAPHPSTVLTEICLNKNMKKDYLLPPRTHFSLKSINQLMNRDVSLINKVLKNQAEKLPCSLLNDEDKILNYDYDNANDMLEFCPRPASLVADDDGNVTLMNNNDFDAGFDNDDDLGDHDAYTGCNSFQNLDFGNYNDQDAVTANVKRVEQIDIEYAKTAKRINVKKLKSQIWTTLKTSINANEVEDMKNMTFPNVPKTSATSLFSDILVDVDQKISKEASNDLSVSILMTCLLHLSNETGLDLINTVDFTDLMIGQGYSDYDVEQVNKFGIGNCLINDSRKRKSLDKPDINHKRRSAIGLSDVDDE